MDSSMTTEIINGMTVLTPSEDKYLTNGDTYSRRVYLGKNASADDWQEVDSIPDETDDPDLTAEEALDIIVGGGTNA